VVGRDRLLRIGRQAGGGGLDAGPVREDALGRGGAEAVAGAEEEEVGQRALGLSTRFKDADRLDLDGEKV